MALVVNGPRDLPASRERIAHPDRERLPRDRAHREVDAVQAVAPAVLEALQRDQPAQCEDDDVGNAFCFVDQSKMSLVEGAHRRHERDALALRAHIGNYVPHLVDGIYLLHARSCVRRPGMSRLGHPAPTSRWQCGLLAPSLRIA